MSDHNRFSDRDTDSDANSRGYYSNSHTDSYSNGHTDSYSNLCLVLAGCSSMSKGECVC